MRDGAVSVVRRFISEMWARQRLDLIDGIMHPEYRADGDCMTLMFEWVGTQDGVFAGIEPTGRRVPFRRACVFRVENG